MNNKQSKINSMRAKLIISMAMICIIPLAIAVTISFGSSSAVSRDNAMEMNLKQAQFVENNFIDNIEANFRAMEQVASSASTREFIKSPKDKDKLADMVKQLQYVDESFGDGNSTVITGMDGENIARSTGDFVNIAEREYFQEAASGKTFLSEMSISKTTGARIVVPAVPVFDDDGSTVIGVLTRNYNVGYLHEILAEEATKGQTISIMGKDGTVIAVSTQELGPDDDLNQKDGEAFKRADAGELTGSFIEKVDGKKCVTSYVRDELSGWTFVVFTEYNVIMAEANRSMLIVLIIGIILSILAIILAILFGNGIDRPISAIDESLELLANGEFKDIEIGIDRKDEFGTMIVNTNAVIDKLKSIVDAIRQTAEDLENDSVDVADTASQISTTMESVSEAVQ